MERNHVKRFKEMNYFRILVLCFAVLHYAVACGVLWCICSINGGLMCVMSSAYLVFCVQHTMAMESLFPKLRPMVKKNHRIIELCKCSCYLILELIFFLFHVGIIVLFLYKYFHWGVCLLFTIHFVVHCIMSYVSIMRISETGRFMFCDIRNGTSWPA